MLIRGRNVRTFVNFNRNKKDIILLIALSIFFADIISRKVTYPRYNEIESLANKNNCTVLHVYVLDLALNRNKLNSRTFTSIAHMDVPLNCEAKLVQEMRIKIALNTVQTSSIAINLYC